MDCLASVSEENNLPSVYISNSGRLWCSWQAEPHPCVLGPPQITCQLLPNISIVSCFLLPLGMPWVRQAGRQWIPQEQPLPLGKVWESSVTILRCVPNNFSEDPSRTESLLTLSVVPCSLTSFINLPLLPASLCPFSHRAFWGDNPINYL